MTKPKTTYVTITQPSDWVASWKVAADAEGKTLSEWIGEKCNESLPRSTQRKLSERVGRGQPRKAKD